MNEDVLTLLAFLVNEGLCLCPSQNKGLFLEQLEEAGTHGVGSIQW